MTIPYVGAINAYALSFMMEDPKYFKNDRQFVAHAGVTPSFTGTGRGTNILGVGKKVISVLKRTMFQSNLSMLRYNKVDCENDPEIKSKRRTNLKWISQLGERLPLKKAVCAISNKVAGVAWAIAEDPSCGKYDESKTSLLYRIKKDIENKDLYAKNQITESQLD